MIWQDMAPDGNALSDTGLPLGLEGYLPPLLELARGAGLSILREYAGPGSVSFKADDSPLTAADRASNLHILTGLRKLTPNIPIISEEGGSDVLRDSEEMFWLIDPLDGTKEFIKQTGQFTVNLALIQRAQVILGLVYAPAL